MRESQEWAPFDKYKQAMQYRFILSVHLDKRLKSGKQLPRYPTKARLSRYYYYYYSARLFLVERKP